MYSVLYTVKCAGCSVLPVKDDDLSGETGYDKLKFYRCSTNTSVLVLQKWIVCKKKYEHLYIYTFATCPTYLCICAQKPQPRP